jgi:hypothetical protein
LPSAEQLLTATFGEKNHPDGSLDASDIVVFEHKYGSLDDSQVDAILTGDDYRARYELMRYAHATGNKELARQIKDRLGKDGLRQTLLEATTNNLAPMEQREKTLEYVANLGGEIGQLLKGQIVPKGEPRAEQVKEHLDKLRAKFGELLAKHGGQK